MRTAKALASIALLASACTSSPPVGDAATDVPGIDTVTMDAALDVAPPHDAAPEASRDAGLAGARPYSFIAPIHYDASVPTPLVILLHGYGANGSGQDLYFRLGMLAQQRTFLYAYPDGTVDSMGHRFWNATDACCNFDHMPIDDVAYVASIIDDVSAQYNVDTHRIFVVGHSNGGFMSHRLACDLTSRIAAVVTLAGVNWNDMTMCRPSGPISVLQVHGDADAEIVYTGGDLFGVAYPGALATANGWAMRNHCSGALADTGTTLDLDTSLAGAETSVSAARGCDPGSAVELWTIHGGSHIPALSSTWAATIYDWLMAHPKP